MDNAARISVLQDGDTVTVVGGGTLDLTNCTSFSSGLKHAAQTAENVVVDLRGADFIDTQIVQDLARAAVNLLEKGKRLQVMASETKYPLRVIRISGFEKIMDLVIDK